MYFKFCQWLKMIVKMVSGLLETLIFVPVIEQHV